MIRYAITEKDLRNKIIALDASWFEKAKRRTDKFIKAGKYSEKSSIWSVTKPAYLNVQKNKCIFCERQFENEEYGRIEYDVEHFRPKSAVKAWPTSANLNYGFATGDAAPLGYYWLAYDVGNYAASCKVCNSVLKGGYFPIRAARGTCPDTVKVLSAEQPFLCNPLDADDDDPETLVTFEGTLAVPSVSIGAMNERGRVIIDFFKLNRDLLHRERAKMIAVVGPSALSVARTGGAPEDVSVITKARGPWIPHASCVRAFIDLAMREPDEAEVIMQRCRQKAVGDFAA